MNIPNQRELDYVIKLSFVLIYIRYVSVLFHLSSFYAPIFMYYCSQFESIT